MKIFWRHGIGEERTKQTLVIPGFHAVRESLSGPVTGIQEIWIEAGKRGGRVDELVHLAKRHGVPIYFKPQEDIVRTVPGVTHQGVVALAGGFSYLDLEELLTRSLNVQGHRLILAADHITDEGNLGALMRTAAFFGVNGLVLPKDRSAQVSGKLLKRTSGAYLHISVAQVINLGRALDFLKKSGFWAVGAAGEARVSIYDFDWSRDTVLILGSESKGLSRAVRDRCDEIVRIPGADAVASLNVSVAGGIILAEILRRRSKEIP